MSGLIRIDPEMLREIATGNKAFPSLYCHPNPLLRHVFWWRLGKIDRLIDRVAPAARTCLDFGGGSGVFLPTLSKRFRHVCLLDLNISEAAQVVTRYGLNNVELVEADITSDVPGNREFDIVVAADVLEHFRDLAPPISAVKRMLAPHGYLVTSLPRENWLYVMLRAIFNIEKPADHYYRSAEVERFLEAQGFSSVGRSYMPTDLFTAPLFSIRAWSTVEINRR